MEQVEMFKPRNEIVLDLEIQKSIRVDKEDPITEENPLKETEVDGFQNSPKAGVSVVCIYDYVDGRYKFYDYFNMHELIERWKSADRIIGYNHKSFDYGVLYGSGYKEFVASERDFDILDLIWRQLRKRVKGFKLDQVSRLTIGKGKSGDGADAPKLFQAGRFAELFTYSLDDVVLTKEVYDFYLKYGYIIGGDNQKLLLEKTKG